MTRPTVTFQSDCLHIIVEQAERYLIQSGEPIYQRDGKIIRIGRFPTKEGRPDLRFVEVTREWLVEKLTEIVGWSKLEGKKTVPISCPISVAATYLALAVITAPTLRPDGSLLIHEGYDDQTGLYFDPQGVKFANIPEHPSREDARNCLDSLIGTVSEVPFVLDENYGQISRWVFLSAILSALIRTILPAVPLHGFSAPAAGSGKSILVDGIAYLLTGNPASPLTQGDEAETTKILSSALQAGMAVISFDNCETPLGGAMLCQAVSQPRLALRTLGKSELRQITNTAMYFATGNNLLFTGDIIRRAMRCRVDAKCERPEERKFTTLRPDLLMWDNRVDVVMAGLIILRAFFHAGCPSKLEPVGNFERWSQIVRSSLVWLGEPDPWLTTNLIRDDDPRGEIDTAALHAWWDCFHDNMMMTKDVVEAAKKKTDGGNGIPPKFINNALYDALVGITNNDLTSQNIGDWLKGIKDRPLGGFMVLQGGKLHGNNRWQIIKTTEEVKKDSFRESIFS